MSQSTHPFLFLVFSYFTVGAIDCVVACITVPIIAKRNVIPLLYCAVKYYACKRTTTTERIIINTYNTIRNCYTCKRTATIEQRITINTCNAIRYCYACKSTTSTERATANTCNTIGDCDTCKSDTAIESRTNNTCNIVRNNTILTS